MGDPAGVGPEVLLMALAEPDLGGRLPVRVFAARGVLERLAAGFGWPLDFERVEAAADPGANVSAGRYTPEGGRAQLACLEAAAAELAAGRLGALVTGPIHKRALADAGRPGWGHTEWLGHRFGARRPVMMLAGPRLKVILATTHLALRQVPAALTADGLEEVIRVAAADLRRFFHPAGLRLALAALNPHGEEDGHPGLEERELLAPCVQRCRAAGIDLSGPLPGDAVFAQAAAGRYDAVIALYHDQGLAAVKTLHFADAVNVTLGLGRVRTSPDHGPAYDLAGSGRADPSSMKAAIALAARMAACAQEGA